MIGNDVGLEGFQPDWPDALFQLGHNADPDTVGPVPGVKIHVWLSYYAPGDPVSLWDHAQWDTAGSNWTGDAIEHDLGCESLSVSTSQGRDAPLGRFRVGTASVVIDDPEGNFTPWRDAANPDEYARIRPGIGLRITATWNGFEWPLFKGTVDHIADDFPNITGHTVTFNASDDLSLLAAYDGLEQPPVGSGDFAADRLRRIFDLIGYLVPTKLDPGTIPLQATILNQNMDNEAGITVDTELGALFCDKAGVVTFRDRNGLETDPHYREVQLTFGEVEPELCYDDIALVMDIEQVRNIVTVTQAKAPDAPEGTPDPTPVTVVDTGSISRYGRHTYARNDLIFQNPDQANAIGAAIIDTFKDAAQRVDSITFRPSTFASVIEAALTVDLLWLIEVRRRAQGFQVVAELQVESVDHSISAHEWAVTLKTYSAAAVFNAAQWDRSLWDEGLWGY